MCDAAEEVRHTASEAYEAIGTARCGWGNRDIDETRADFEAAVVDLRAALDDGLKLLGVKAGRKRTP